ncbi:MAG: helix-turn-helix transcriptional regulator [Micromonosporaceae bacterium]|nr:helix-turn-helix transcriptional regulator [Micromonosporaceae bacterium]
MARRHRLAQRRKTVGLSQEGLAETVGVDRTTVVRWERSDNAPQPWHRPRLAHALKISVEELAELLAHPTDPRSQPIEQPYSADERPRARSDAASVPPSPIADEREDARQLLAHAAQIAVGAAVLDPEAWLRPLGDELAPAPERVGHADVSRLESITRGLKTLDSEHGGGSCRDAVVAQARWGRQLLRASCSDTVGRRLHIALADLHSLAGWTSFDVGLYDSAKLHFARSLEQARFADEPSLVAKVLYCIGRLYLHRGWATESVRVFQLGQLAAQESGCELADAMLCANQAWAYAILGEAAQLARLLGRAEDEFAGAHRAEAPPWIRFFGEADLRAMTAMAYAHLPEPTSAQRAVAIRGFEGCLAARQDSEARSRAFELSALATVHLADGDLDYATTIGHQAIDLAERVRSIRIVDRLAPLAAHADKHRNHADVRELAHRIRSISMT